MKILLVLLFTTLAHCWDQEDLEVFDVVEEVGKNFYDFLEIPENADLPAIKKAYRKLTLLLHPDKVNAPPDAEIQFPVYDILKDPLKRSKYNDVLENGLPDWKQAVYYYRRVRKMGLFEMCVILFIIITIGQYLVAWAAYLERKYTIEEYVSIKSKKLQKRQKRGKHVDIDAVNNLPDLVNGLPKPSITGTLPVQVCKLVWFLIIDLPPLTYYWVKEYFERRKQAQEEQEEESSEEEAYVPRERGPRRRKGFTLPEMNEDTSKEVKPQREKIIKAEKPPVLAGGLWTDDDFTDLIRLMKKFPPGTQERWEKIGESMQRTASEVAHMAHKMKDEGFKPVKKDEEVEPEVEEQPKKVKTKGGKHGDEGLDDKWTQVQQKAFEQALAVYPKGSVSDRWEKIAKTVPGKTKEECMVRFKSLAELVKKKKQNEEEEPPS